MAIQMISGYTNFNHRLIGPNDGPVELPEDVEQRLVALGIAEYAAVAAQAPRHSDFSAEQGVDPAMDEIGAQASTVAADALNEPQEPPLDSMTMAELKELAENMGISVKGLRSKAAVIAAIEADKPPDPKVME